MKPYYTKTNQRTPEAFVKIYDTSAFERFTITSLNAAIANMACAKRKASGWKPSTLERFDRLVAARKELVSATTLNS